MAIVAQVENGKLVESASQSSLSGKIKTGTGSEMDKDAFLQLLVAQMKYQDPLEPTSNTEYIAQYAQFSQVEQMQNMAASMDLQRASGLVGQEVYIKTTGSDGDTKYVQGKVDYVVYENGKAYLSIDEALYSIDDLDTVVDKEYLGAYNKAMDFAKKLANLPNVNGIDLADASTIDELEDIYNGMSEYEKTFIAKDIADTLEKYVERLKEIRLAAQETASKPSTGENAEEADSDGTEGAGEV